MMDRKQCINFENVEKETSRYKDVGRRLTLTETRNTKSGCKGGNEYPLQMKQSHTRPFTALNFKDWGARGQIQNEIL